MAAQQGSDSETACLAKRSLCESDHPVIGGLSLFCPALAVIRDCFARVQQSFNSAARAGVRLIAVRESVLLHVVY